MPRSSPTPFRPIRSTRRTTLLLLPAAILTLWGCTNTEPNFLGGNLIADGDLIPVRTDTTFALSAFTLSFDSISLPVNNFEEAAIGSIYCPIFGRTQSSFAIQLGLRQEGADIGAAAIVDSAYLTMALTAFSGHRNIPIQVRVHELADSLIPGKAYNMLDPTPIRYHPTPIGAITYTGEIPLRIPIDLAWARRVIGFDTTTLSTQSNLLRALYGIFITTSQLTAHGKAMYYFNLASFEGAIDIYYRNTPADTASRTFTLTMNRTPVHRGGTFVSTTRFNLFAHHREAASPQHRIRHLNRTDVQDSVFYIQGMGGLRGMIRLDGVVEWARRMPIAINRAELRIETERGNPLTPNDSIVPPRLLVYTVGPLDFQSIADVTLETHDGRYYKSRGYYSVNITHHLQNLLKEGGAGNNTLFIMPSQYLRANGAVLRSASHSSPLRLIITYTQL